jgi:RNA polymerase sigma-70 factor (ECF subfamily)
MRFEPDFLAADIASHRPHLYRYALKELRDPVAADDAVQETFAAALTGQCRFEGRSGTRTWLIGILKHKILDEYRRRAREPRAATGLDEDGNPSAFDLDQLEAGAAGEAAAAGYDPEYAAARKRFWGAFSEHPGDAGADGARIHAARDRRPRHRGGVRGARITPGNLWVLLHRARHKLRDAIDGDSREYFLAARLPRPTAGRERLTPRRPAAKLPSESFRPEEEQPCCAA